MAERDPNNPIAEAFELAKAYADHILNLPAMQEWIEGARAEHDFLADDEPYRTGPDAEALVAANQ